MLTLSDFFIILAIFVIVGWAALVLRDGLAIYFARRKRHKASADAIRDTGAFHAKNRNAHTEGRHRAQT